MVNMLKCQRLILNQKGILGKKAALEIDKIKMSREQKLDQEFLEKMA